MCPGEGDDAGDAVWMVRLYVERPLDTAARTSNDDRATGLARHECKRGLADLTELFGPVHVLRRGRRLRSRPRRVAGEPGYVVTSAELRGPSTRRPLAPPFLVASPSDLRVTRLAELEALLEQQKRLER